eukprot:GEMP01021293.1.p1 GENE.GEMP01021293.1~~GEMP01021293.1.p1  ORF type:complete len:258 (+),score=59.52 GEMP01021293.1:181-954(+)
MFPGMFNDDPFFGGGGGERRQGSGNGQLANRSSRQDPFAMMEGMMGGFGNFGGMGGMGGMMMPFGGGRDPFENFDLMDMNRGGMGGGGGQFACQSMVMSSRMGPDGKMQVEQFASSSAGDATRGIHERQQAYSNSASGVDKMSMERQMGSQGRKMIKERTRGTQDERQTDLYRGMDESEADAFDNRWSHDAAPHMPRHGGFPLHRMVGNDRGSGGGRNLPLENGPSRRAAPDARHERDYDRMIQDRQRDRRGNGRRH